MRSMQLKMAVTDLDGTLLRSDRSVSKRDYETLVELGRRGVTRVIATGRSPFSLRKVLPPSFPVDYVIFSSGCGIFDWPERRLLRAYHLSGAEVTKLSRKLIAAGADFMVHDPIPENHRFSFHGEGRGNPDFHRRIRLYRRWAAPLEESPGMEKSCQIVAVFPETGYDFFLRVRQGMSGVAVIRTTSPLDHRSHWMEILPEGAGKDRAAAGLAETIGVAAKNVIAVGNDYNDLPLLRWAGAGFAVANACRELKEEFPAVAANDDDGFSEAIGKALLSD